MALAVLLVAAVAVVGLRAVGIGSTGVALEDLPGTGVYVGAGDPDAVRAFEQWVGGGADVRLVSDFLSADDWSTVAASSGYPLQQWEGTGLRVVYGVPLLPTAIDGREVEAGGNGDLLAAGADGDHDR